MTNNQQRDALLALAEEYVAELFRAMCSAKQTYALAPNFGMTQTEAAVRLDQVKNQYMHAKERFDAAIAAAPVGGEAKYRIDVGGTPCGEAPASWDAVDAALLHWYGHAVNFSQGERQRFYDAVRKYFTVAQPDSAEGEPVCATCNDNGMIGGPSYREPDEGGVPCPDCADKKVLTNDQCRRGHRWVTDDIDPTKCDRCGQTAPKLSAAPQPECKGSGSDTGEPCYRKDCDGVGPHPQLEKKGGIMATDRAIAQAFRESKSRVFNSHEEVEHFINKRAAHIDWRQAAGLPDDFIELSPTMRDAILNANPELSQPEQPGREGETASHPGTPAIDAAIAKGRAFIEEIGPTGKPTGYIMRACADMLNPEKQADTLRRVIDETPAWTEEDMERPWGAEVAALRHLADDPALNVEQAATLRHCAKRIEATAGRPHPSPQGVDLEQFRAAVIAWKHEGESRYSYDGMFHLKLGPNHYRAMQLLDVIDGAKINPQPGAVVVTQTMLADGYAAFINAKVMDPNDTRERLGFAYRAMAKAAAK